MSLMCFLFSDVRTTSAQASREDVLAQAIASWQRRGELVRSASFELATRQHIPKGAYTFVAKRKDPKATPSPPHDVSIDWKEQFLFDGDQMRWENTRPKMMHPDWRPIPKTFIATFDGEVSKSLSKASDETSETGAIRQEKGVPEAEGANVKPLMYAFRPFHQASRQISRENLTLTDDQPVVDGRKCVAVRSNGPGLPLTYFWIDPTRGHSVVREYIVQQDKVVFDLTVTYSEHSDCGWMPATWKAATFQADGRVRNYIEASVASATLNPSIPKEVFDVTFPVGAIVRDEKGKRNATVKEGGQLETVTKWASSKPDQPDSRISNMWYLAAGALLCLVIVAAILRVQRRRSRRSG